MAKIGVYGGTFNPPHLGHRLAICEFATKLELDRILVIPDAEPPHKTMPDGSPPPEVRLQLCRLMAEGLPFVEFSDMEIRRSGKSYTADTISELKALHPDDTLVFLVGTDMLLTFDRWYCPERITASAELAMAHRKDPSPEEQAAIAQQKEKLEAEFGAKVTIIENDLIDISSSAVRTLLRFGCGGEVVGSAVMSEIRRQNLYHVNDCMSQLPFEALKAVSLSMHKPKRRAHAEGCCETAVALAARWGADQESAARAGILHDVTKALSAHEQLILCKKYDILIDNVIKANPKLLHAVTGAAVAKQVFREPEDVCSAIRWHTTGRAGMTQLEKIIYLADLIEPTRDFPGVEELRRLAEEDLNGAMRAALERSVTFVEAGGNLLHPDSLSALHDFEEHSP